MAWCKQPYEVNVNNQEINMKTTPSTSNGINASNAYETIGGTLSGILIVHPCCLIYTYIRALIKPTNIAENIPCVPNHVVGIVLNEADLSATIFKGVKIRKFINAMIPAMVPSSPLIKCGTKFECLNNYV